VSRCLPVRYGSRRHIRTDQEPVHLEQPERRGVREEVDRLVLFEAALVRELNGLIDAKERRR
jgi:hypothetical protein